jgi:hypothetical protein
MPGWRGATSMDIGDDNWVGRGMDWLHNTDQWIRHPVWTALLFLGIALIAVWYFLHGGEKSLSAWFHDTEDK